MRGPLAKIRQAHLPQRLLDAVFHFGFGQAQLLRAERHVLGNGRAEQLIIRVLKHEAHLSADGLEVLAGDGCAVDPHRFARACFVGKNPIEVQEQRGFARAIGAKQTDTLAGLDAKTHPAQRVRSVVITVAEIPNFNGGGRAHAWQSRSAPRRKIFAKSSNCQSPTQRHLVAGLRLDVGRSASNRSMLILSTPGRTWRHRCARRVPKHG